MAVYELLTWRREEQGCAVESDGVKVLITAVEFQRQMDLVGPDARVIVQSHDNLAPTLPSVNQSVSQ